MCKRCPREPRPFLVVCAARGEEGANFREADAVVVDGGGDDGSGGEAAQAEEDGRREG